jgi:hypothetical protein
MLWKAKRKANEVNLLCLFDLYFISIDKEVLLQDRSHAPKIRPTSLSSELSNGLNRTNLALEL